MADIPVNNIIATLITERVLSGVAAFKGINKPNNAIKSQQQQYER